MKEDKSGRAWKELVAFEGLKAPHVVGQVRVGWRQRQQRGGEKAEPASGQGEKFGPCLRGCSGK